MNSNLTSQGDEREGAGDAEEDIEGGAVDSVGSLDGVSQEDLQSDKKRIIIFPSFAEKKPPVC